MTALRDRNSINNINAPLVSVVMIAYQLESYISAAIESVLDQKLDFDVELVIGEDCSRDATRSIALDYQSRYPNIIRVLEHPHNLGLTPNCIATHNACKGKYIALLDGDDYWTSPYKLKRQISFLEENPSYAGAAHQSMKIYDDNSSPDLPFGSYEDADLTLIDTLSHRKFHTSSLVYKREYWLKTEGIPKTISSNERAIYPMVASFGPIRYFGDCMCVYRCSGYGLSSRVDYKELESDLDMLIWLKRINQRFPMYRFRSFLHLCMFTYGKKDMPIPALIKHYLLFALFSFAYFPKNLGDLKWGSLDFIKRLIQRSYNTNRIEELKC